MILEPFGLPRRLAFQPVANRRGSILIISLWSLCLLTTFAVTLGYGVRQKIILVLRLEERDKLRFIAEAGIKKAIVELGKGLGGLKEAEGEKTYNSLNDSWSSNAGAFREIKVGDGTFTISYNYLNKETGLPETRYGLVDEERKININKADRAILQRLFIITLNFNAVEAQELASCLIDWRDSDSELSIPFGSAEDRDYRYLQYPYEAKDSDFEVLEEALLVKGMTIDTFRKIKEYITIYGDGKININTASKEIFLALGLKEEIADKILLFRQGEDGVIGTIDDNVFDKHSTIVPKLSQFAHLSDYEVAQLSRTIDCLVTKSDHFMIKSTAKLSNRRNTAKVTCVIDRSGKILYWQEGL